MGHKLQTIVFSLAVLAFSDVARGEDAGIEPISGPEADVLARITAFHSVLLKAAHLEARILEDDGSASVALDPIRLYLVVTNGGTSNYVGHTWELPRGVSKVRGLAPSSCGVDLLVEFDEYSERTPEPIQVRRSLALCFLDRGGALSKELRISERPTRRKKLK
jgi:hypothetical protein